MSPVLFILDLDQIFQKYDMKNRRPKFCKILRLKVFGYADAVTLIDGTVNKMTTRFTKIVDKSESEVDMVVS